MTGVGIKTKSRLDCQMLGDVGEPMRGTRRQGDGGTVIKQVRSLDQIHSH